MLWLAVGGDGAMMSGSVLWALLFGVLIFAALTIYLVGRLDSRSDAVGITVSRKRRPEPVPRWEIHAVRLGHPRQVTAFFDEDGEPVFYNFGCAFRALEVARWLTAGADDLRPLDEVLAAADEDRKRWHQEKLELEAIRMRLPPLGFGSRFAAQGDEELRLQAAYAEWAKARMLS